MDTENLNSGGIQKDLSKDKDQHMDFGVSMDTIEEKFSDLREDLEGAGQNVMKHLKTNRQSYLMVAASAIVLGGAYLLFQKYGSSITKTPDAGKARKGKPQINSKVH